MSNNPVPKGVNLEYSSFGMKQKQGQFQGVKPEESKKGKEDILSLPKICCLPLLTKSKPR